MAKPLQIGKSNFAELVRGGYLFVDKSALFISAVVTDSNAAIVITRPRRWGKSLNLSMLHHFLAPVVNGLSTKGLFDGLEISKISGDYIAKHQGQYPVIFLSLKDLKVATFEEFLDGFRSFISSIYGEHEKLLNAKDNPWSEFERQQFKQYHMHTKLLSVFELQDSLKKLSELLHKFYKKKAYILIDEYDTPLNHAFASSDYFERAALFMRNFFSAGMKDNPFVEKGVMTGILRVSKDSMLSGLNNVETYTVLNDDRYYDAFGFTQKDLVYLFEDQGLLRDEPKVQDWYNGYQINGLTLYNPWSIMNCIKKKGQLQPYWVLSGDDKLLKELIQGSSESIKQQLAQLMLGETLQVRVADTMRFDEVRKNEGMLWNLLLFGGYLKVLKAEYSALGSTCEVAVPNQEVLMSYQGIFLSWIQEISSSDSLFKAFMKALLAGDIERFVQDVQLFLESASSVHDYATQPEAFYQGFMLALMAAMMDAFYVSSNTESGRGRPDMILIPKAQDQHTALILEYKIANAKQSPKKLTLDALQQIKTKNYSAKITQHRNIKEIMMVGLVFKGKTVHYLSEKINFK